MNVRLKRRSPSVRKALTRWQQIVATAAVDAADHAASIAVSSSSDGVLKFTGDPRFEYGREWFARYLGRIDAALRLAPLSAGGWSHRVVLEAVGAAGVVNFVIAVRAVFFEEVRRAQRELAQMQGAAGVEAFVAAAAAAARVDCPRAEAKP